MIAVVSQATAFADAHRSFLGRGHFAGLDGLRCAAILAVLWHHSLGAAPFAHPVFGRGYLGVDLFFVLSGFLITTILARQQREGGIDLKRFYWRRSLRIFPLYYAYLIGLLGLYAATDRAKLSEYLEVLPTYALYLTNWVDHGRDHVFERGWSLAVEEQFYLAWPLLLMLGRAAAGWAALAAVTVATLWLGSESGATGRLLIPFRTILIGCGLALILDRPTGFTVLQRVLGYRVASVVVAASLLGVVASASGELTGATELGAQLLMAALVAAVALNDRNALNPLLCCKPARLLGVISYGVYVLHGQLSGATSALLRSLGGAGLAESRVAFFALFTALSAAAAGASYALLERRFLQLKGEPPSLRSLMGALRR